MDFGNCIKCKQYKYLINKGKCVSCSPEPLFNSENTLLLGRIGTGKTVKINQHINRKLDIDKDTEVYIIDIFKNYNQTIDKYESKKEVIDSTVKLNPIKHIPKEENLYKFIDNILVDVLDYKMDEIEKISLKNAIKKHSGKIETITDISKIENAYNERLSKKLGCLSESRYGRQSDITIDPVKRVNYFDFGNHLNSATDIFSIFSQVYETAISTDKESIIILDSSSYLLKSFGNLLGEYYQESGNKNINILMSSCDVERFSNKNYDNYNISLMDTVAILGCTPKCELYDIMGIPKDIQDEISDSSNIYELFSNKNNKWEHNPVKLTDYERKTMI